MDAGDARRGHRVGLRDVPRVPRLGRAGAAPSLNFTAYVGHTRAAALRDGRRRLRARRHRRRDRADVPRSSREAIDAGAAGLRDQLRRTRTAAIDGKPVPSRFAERDEVEALFLAAGEHRARAWCSSRRASSAPTPTCTSAAAHRAPVHLSRCSRSPTAGTSTAARAARGGPWRAARRSGRRSRRGRSRCSSRWPTPFSLNIGTVFGELHERRPRRRASPRTAIPAWRALAAADLEQSPMKPRWETFEVSESRAVPRARGPAGRRPRRASAACGPLDVMCDLALAEDLETRFRVYIANDDVDAVRHLLTHEQRRARPVRRRRARRPAVRRAAAHRPARQLGARPRGHAARARGAQAHRRAGRHVRLRATAATCARATWADVVRVRSRRPSRPGPIAAGARLPGRRRAPHRRGARPACATCSSTARRSASTRCSSTRRCARACVPNSAEAPSSARLDG